jgi:hypothetical protein
MVGAVMVCEGGRVWQKRGVNAGTGLSLEGKSFRCCIRGTGDATRAGGSSDMCIIFLTLADCIMMVLQLKADRKAHPCKSGIYNLYMIPYFHMQRQSPGLYSSVQDIF